MEREIIITAVENLKNNTGLDARFKPMLGDATYMDGALIVMIGDKKLVWRIECKNHITLNFMAAIVDLKNQKLFGNDKLIIAEHIYPNDRKKMQELGINYADATGNAFLKRGNVFILIDGLKRQVEAEKNVNRAFANAGLKVLFYILFDKTNINKTIRDIAANTGTALDTVHKTINALAQMKHLIKINEKESILTDTKALFEQWIQAYNQKLKPKLFTGNFRFALKEDEKNWDKIIFTENDTVWGGENAGAIMTNYLNPEIFTIYTTCNKAELAKKYKLIPDTNGNVKVYTKFWNFPAEEKKTTPALLTYADLIATKDDRCIETANIIYNELLKNRYQ